MNSRSMFEQLSEALAPQYEVERELASGGMGTVFLARDTVLDRTVAVKIVRREDESETGAKRLLNEARILAHFSHPNVVSIHQAGQLGESFYYVMDYVEGETLEDRLKHRRLTADEAVQLGIDILEALSAAHDHGTVHRDVKPANIFLLENRAVLGDFGIAKQTETAATGLTESGHRLGTPGYMPPEQAAGDEVTPATDLYALGMVLYEALTGRRWSVPVTPAAENDWSGVPRGLLPVIKKSLTWEPTERWADASAFRRALRDAETGTRSNRKARIAIGLAFSVLLLSAALYAAFLRAPTESRYSLAVVAPFANLTGIDSLRSFSVAARLVVEQAIGRSASLQLIPSGETDRFLAASQESGTLGALERAIQLASYTGADIAVDGSYFAEGDSLYVEAQFIAVGRREVVRMLTVGSPLGDTRQALESLYQAVQTIIASEFDRTDLLLLNLTDLPNPAALSEYLAATETEDAEEQLALFLRAAELDSTFVRPLLRAAGLLHNMREMERADSLMHEVQKSRARLPELERLHVDYYHADINGNCRSGLEAARRIADITGHRNFGIIRMALCLNRPREAVEAFDSYQHEPAFARFIWHWWFWAFAHHALGEYEEELQIAQRAALVFPSEPIVIHMKVAALAARGDVGQIEALIDESLAIPAGRYPPGEIMTRAAVELRAHGYGDRVGDLLKRAIDWYRVEGPANTTADWQREWYPLLFARTLYTAGRWDEAKTQFEALARDTTRTDHRQDAMGILGSLGAIEAQRGHVAEAERISERLGAMGNAYTYGAEYYWQARIAAILGREEEAVRLLRTALTNRFKFMIPVVGFPRWQLHAEPDFESLWDYGPFQQLMAPKG